MQECNFCGVEFENDRRDRLYCSKICMITNRRDRIQTYNRNEARKLRGTLERWANILREEGYTVIKNG